MKRTLLYSLTATLLAFTACDKVVHLDLNNTTPQLVIEGTVDNTTGPYQVSITKSVDFYQDNVYPGVSGAIVKLIDSTLGITDSLTETANPGVYNSHFLRGIPGNTYQLYVQLEGKEYRASSTMPNPVRLDSITFYKDDDFGGDHPLIRPEANYQDPAGIANYYQYECYVNSKRMQHVLVFDDRLSDGRYIRDRLFTDTNDIRELDTLQMRLHCVDKPTWNFLNEVSLITEDLSQVAAPYNPDTNISGGCLGYFSAQTTSSKTVIVHTK